MRPNIHMQPTDIRSYNDKLTDEIAEFVMKAIITDRHKRFTSAKEMLEALEKIGVNGILKDTSTILNTSTVNANPVDYINSLYSQSRHGNSGTRAGAKTHAFDDFNYTKTKLDKQLIQDIKNLKYKLIIITGNAGDGKTAFIHRIEDQGTNKESFSTNQYSPELLRKQNQDLVQNAKDYLPETANGGLFLNKEGVELLGLWCRSPKQMRRFLGIILNAKKAVEREHEGTAIVLDDPRCQEMINKTMRRFFNILRSDSKKINNVENYLFGAMKETLVAYWNKSLMTANGGDPNEF